MAGSNGYHVAPRTGVDHEFASGSKARLEEGYPVQRLLLSGAWDEETLELFGRTTVKGAKIKPQEMVRVMTFPVEIVCAMWLEPRIVPPGQTPGDGEVSFLDLPEEDIQETLDIAVSGGADVSRFPGDADGAAGGGDGAGVAEGAKRVPRPAARKRSGAARGRAARGAAGGVGS